MINVYNSNSHNGSIVERMERKFFVPPQNIDRARMLLRHLCLPDTLYPKEQINSLYFDTADLEEYEASDSGELQKRKIRIRWYHTITHYTENVPVFLELKSRKGFAGSKQRQQMQVAVDFLKAENLYKGIVPASALIDILAAFGYYPQKPLQPVIVISYLRDRFIEPSSGQRVALDYHIHSTMIDYRYRGISDLNLAGGVIEVKGRSLELPPTLRNMHLLDIDWGRFSKYSSCLDAHFSSRETTGQMWPSGKNNPN